MYKKFGFQTKRLEVLKAHGKDAGDVCRLYRSQPNIPKHIDENKIRKSFEEAENDFYQDVTYLVRDRCNKLVGMVETISDDYSKVRIGIWIPNKAKEVSYLKELIDSMIEWCGEYEKYHLISEIQLIQQITAIGATYEDIQTNIKLCAS